MNALDPAMFQIIDAGHALAAIKDCVRRKHLVKANRLVPV
jgi:hypothetical protein